MPPRRTGRTQRGLSLLESLVSMLILVIGVLGMLGVQVRTLSETQIGVRRAQAVRLVEALSERIKANPGGFAQVADYVSDWTAAASGPDCQTASCTSAELASFDVAEWKRSVARALPSGQASVFTLSSEPAPKRQLGVMVGWRVNERNQADTTYQAPFVIDPNTADGVTCPSGFICHLVYVQP